MFEVRVITADSSDHVFPFVDANKARSFARVMEEQGFTVEYMDADWWAALADEPMEKYTMTLDELLAIH